jgi:imidazole glycerol-phosphate synthase subunit HisH
MADMFVIVNPEISNIGSVANAFRRLGVDFTITCDPQVVADAPALVLPGVGSFGDGMASLRAKGLVEPIRKAAGRGTPILGICLGMQLMAAGSTELGNRAGLGLIPGRVAKLEPGSSGDRVPNIGWCDVSLPRESVLFRNIPAGRSFYFVHGYHLECEGQADVVATIGFGDSPVTAAIERNNLFGTQFHPEKSQDAGLTVLADFVAAIG